MHQYVTSGFPTDSAGPADADEGTHGYLALVQLLASAAADQRLTGAQRAALCVLARYAAPDGTCCVSLSTVAAVLGVKRQAAQQALGATQRFGYLASERRHRNNGAEGAKVFTFNLGLAGALACPVRTEGVQAPELAGGCKPQSLQGVQALGLAHKKPSEETMIEETSAGSSRSTLGERRRSGVIEGHAGKGGPQQQPLLLPIKGGRTRRSGQPLQGRIEEFNLQSQREASGRLWGEWAQLDPDLALIDRIGAGRDQVAAKALELEVATRGRGCRYIAGAVERASGGAIRAEAILAGRHALRRALP